MRGAQTLKRVGLEGVFGLEGVTGGVSGPVAVVKHGYPRLEGIRLEMDEKIVMNPFNN